MFPFLVIGRRKYLSQNKCPTNICMSWFQVRPRHVKGFWTNLATKVSHLGLHIFFEFRTCRYWDGPISACPGFTWNQDMQILAQSWFWNVELYIMRLFICFLLLLIGGINIFHRTDAPPISACPTFKKDMQTKVGYFGDQICSKPFDMSWSHLKPGHASQSGFRLPEMY